MSKIFSSIFLQPPTFLEMPYVGLEISDSAVRFVEFIDKAGVLTLGHFATVPLTEGIVSDGEIKEEKKLASILTELKKKYSLEFVKVSLPENKSYLFKMQLPGQLSKPAEIRQAIEFRLEENIPIQTKDAIFDFEIIDTSPDGTVKNISVSASPAQLVENYTRCLTSAGLTPISFEVESKSVARAVVAKNDARPYIVLNIKDKTTTISIVERGQVEFSSSANI
ncbi:MAG: pilus assembly protein PilM, partial [bacterium]